MSNPLPNHGRRGFLAGSAGLLTVLGLPGLATAAAQPGAAVANLDNGMHVISGVGGNVLAVKAGAGALLVDTGAAAATPALLDALAGVGMDRVQTVFNTHWHLDQVGGNEHFGRAGAAIVAHKKTRLHLSIPYYLFEEDRYQQPLPEAAWPGETFYTQDAMETAAGRVECGYLQSAHTDGDIYVRFPGANVIAVGDVVSPEVDPGFDWFGGGWIGGRVDSLNLILDMCDDATRVVPAHGPVIGKAHVEAERDLMQFLYDTLVDQIREGFSAEDSLASGIMDNLPRKFDDPYKFLYDAHKGLWAHHNKLAPNIV